MTREEMEMRKLVRESDVIDKTNGTELARAFNHLWNKYIEQEVCEDAISRQAVLELVEKGVLISNGNYKSVCNAINELPSVNPQEPKWIPVSERLPKEVGAYMTTVDYEKHGIAVGQVYYHGKHIGWENDCVIAWMPLPEPYKADMRE